jgi:hypothetical protein
MAAEKGLLHTGDINDKQQQMNQANRLSTNNYQEFLSVRLWRF